MGEVGYKTLAIDIETLFRLQATYIRDLKCQPMCRYRFQAVLD